MYSFFLYQITCQVDTLFFMNSSCVICKHSAIIRINQMLVDGASDRSVAAKYGLSPATIGRHRKKCVAALLRGEADQENDSGISGQLLIDQAIQIHKRALSLLDELESRMYSKDEDGQPNKVDVRAIVAALREVRVSLESLAKLHFFVEDRPAPTNPEDMPEIDSAIIKALAERGIGLDDPEPSEPLALGRGSQP